MCVNKTGSSGRGKTPSFPPLSLPSLSPITAILLTHQLAEIHQLAQLPPLQGPSQQSPAQPGGVLLRHIRLATGSGHWGWWKGHGDHAVAAEDVSFLGWPAQRQWLAILHWGARCWDHPPTLRRVLRGHGVYVFSCRLPERGFGCPLSYFFLLAQADVVLAWRVVPSALTTVPPPSALLEQSGGQVDGRGYAAGRSQTHRASSQVGLAGVPPSRVGVRQAQAPSLLLGCVLRGGEETWVELSWLHPAVRHDEQGLPALRAGSLSTSLPCHAQHRASHPAVVTQQTSVPPLDGGLGGVAVTMVGRLVGHDPAHGEAGERRPNGECRHCRCHKQVEGDQALWFN